MAITHPQGWFSAREASAYRHYASQIHNGTIVEVGVHLGRSLSYILPVCKRNENKIIAIDNWSYDPAAYKKFMKWLQASGYADIVDVRKSSSRTEVLNIEDLSLDLVMIDADHSYKSVRADIIAWHPKVKRKSFICGHDYAIKGKYKGLVKAVDELLGKPKNLSDTLWAFRKKQELDLSEEKGR